MKEGSVDTRYMNRMRVTSTWNQSYQLLQQMALFMEHGRIGTLNVPGHVPLRCGTLSASSYGYCMLLVITALFSSTRWSAEPVSVFPLFCLVTKEIRGSRAVLGP
jgi:hypothetical protein